MQVVELSVTQLKPAPWNPNRMDPAMRSRLAESIRRFGHAGVLVVRPVPDGCYEVLSGNQTLGALQELAYSRVKCVVVELDDVMAKLLAQALNHIKGEDDLGLRAEVLKDILATLPQEEVIALLPETPSSLGALASMGTETIAEYLGNWQKAQAARLKHLQFQIAEAGLETVEEAIRKAMPMAKDRQGESPNARGIALTIICKFYLEHGGIV